MSLLNVSDACLAWAKARQPNDFTSQHFEAFQTSNWVLVECGGGGNCFYHSALFLLRLFFPDFMLISQGRMVSVQDKSVTHKVLRNATCAHLGKHWKEIPAALGVNVLDFIGEDEQDLQQYCLKNNRLNTDVEDPVIWAFCHLVCDVEVFHINHNMSVSLFNDLQRPTIFFKLWCNNVHYQVLIPSPPQYFTLLIL